MLLRERIQRNASGRPGPNVITGQYRASWDVRMRTGGGSVTAEVFSDAPQARRLEYGSVGFDSLGRHYRQPPFPHVEAAFRRTEPEVVQALAVRGTAVTARHPLACRAGCVGHRTSLRAR